MVVERGRKERDNRIRRILMEDKMSDDEIAELQLSLEILKGISSRMNNDVACNIVDEIVRICEEEDWNGEVVGLLKATLSPCTMFHVADVVMNDDDTPAELLDAYRIFIRYSNRIVPTSYEGFLYRWRNISEQ